MQTGLNSPEFYRYPVDLPTQLNSDWMGNIFVRTIDSTEHQSSIQEIVIPNNKSLIKVKWQNWTEPITIVKETNFTFDGLFFATPADDNEDEVCLNYQSGMNVV